MSALEIRHNFSYAVSAQALFNALENAQEIREWWTEDCSFDSRKAHLNLHWKAHGWRVVMKIVTSQAPRLVEWVCESSNMQNTDAWEGTRLSFQIESHGESKSKLFFQQLGYKDAPCYAECSEGWIFVLGNSLKRYLETGSGAPYTSDPNQGM